LILSNFFPYGGNGEFTLLAIATDTDGNEVTLGTKTIYCDNENAVKPFGQIDHPGMGATISGSSYFIQGWTLTPQPNGIPIDGSTIDISIDGDFVDHPVYNIYRNDIAAYFPDYQNSDGAGFQYALNTTSLAEGLHTIYVVVADNAGNTEGLGGHFFYVDNILAVDGGDFWYSIDNESVFIHWEIQGKREDKGFILNKRGSASPDWEELDSWKNNEAMCIESVGDFLSKGSYLDATNRGEKDVYYQLMLEDEKGQKRPCADLLILPAFSKSVDIPLLLYPNPPVSTLNIEYYLTYDDEVLIDLMDHNGKWVKTLVDKRHIKGRHSSSLAIEKIGTGKPKATYYIRLLTNNKQEIKSFILLE
jgi:hypothetical protein